MHNINVKCEMSDLNKPLTVPCYIILSIALDNSQENVANRLRIDFNTWCDCDGEWKILKEYYTNT